MFSKTFIVAAFGATAYAATSPLYGQCAGQGYTGPTECASGSVCTYSNPYYSQCLAGSAAASVATSKAATTKAATTKATTTSTKAAAASTSAASSSSGTILKASFTEYGAGDDNGSPNCQTSTTACGFFTSGFNVAASQNLFGVGPGAGAGPACGKCYQLTAETDSSGNALSNAGNSIVVEVTNLCPADSNPLCAQSGLTGTNQYGANVNFDLCIQSGASAALFGSSGVGLALGTAVEVACTSAVGTEET